MKERLDIFLVENSYVPSRAKAQELIKNGAVFVNNKCINKSSYQVSLTDVVKINEDSSILKYVSRAGLKLETAIKEFNIDFKDKVIMDIGSSTGGFTDCALKHGASKVISVDVGNNQMHESLRKNNKVELYENTDIRDFPKKKASEITCAVMDLSFISVTKIVSYIKDYPKLSMIICLIKPQFECGKEIASKYKGIILNKDVHIDVIKNLSDSFYNNGFFLNGLVPSSIRGGDGNIEYLALFEKKDKNVKISYVNVVNDAFKKAC